MEDGAQNTHIQNDWITNAAEPETIEGMTKKTNLI